MMRLTSTLTATVPATIYAPMRSALGFVSVVLWFALATSGCSSSGGSGSRATLDTKGGLPPDHRRSVGRRFDGISRARRIDSIAVLSST